ncbi:hypothetical protein FV225_28885 [Methylobacterium sp. WL93]|nr:hypothetical protein FV225_28885 [Methylobacterium sp. WL93]
MALAQTLALGAAFAWLAVRALTGRDRLVLPWSEILSASAACGAMALALAPLRHLDPPLALGLAVPLGAGLYAAVVWIFDIAGLRSQVAGRVRSAHPLAAE